MKISEFMVELEKIKEKEGDLRVRVTQWGNYEESSTPIPDGIVIGADVYKGEVYIDSEDTR